MAKLDNLWHDEFDNVFTIRYGKPINPRTISKWFHKFIKRHNKEIMNDNTIPKELKTSYLLDNVNFHGLRPTSASMLISEGFRHYNC